MEMDFIETNVLLVTLSVTFGTGGMFKVVWHPILPPLDVFGDVKLNPFRFFWCLDISAIAELSLTQLFLS